MTPSADGTVTAAENAVLEFLRAGPADLGARTGEYTVPRGLPTALREVDHVRLVDAKTTRRLAAAGLVTIEHGRATITPAAEPVDEADQ